MSTLHVIKNCKLTHTNAEILQQWDVSDPNSYHTGIDIDAIQVYSISSGVVIESDIDIDNRYVVTVQYNKDTILRYMHLQSMHVVLGQVITVNTSIGIADKFLHFEYATTTYSNWPVRIGDLNYYKHDPYFVAIGDVPLPDSGLTDYDPYATAHQTIF